MQLLANARKRYRITKQSKTASPEEQLVFEELGYELAVSVIIPIYNTEHYAEEALQSVMGQTLGQIEIICYDDGSTDGSMEIMLRLAEEDPRIRVYHQENSGVNVTRNRAMEHAAGKYLYFMDSDDILEVSSLKEAYQKAEAEKLELVIFNTENLYDTGSPAEKKKGQKGRLFLNGYENVHSGPELLCQMHNNYEFRGNLWLHLIRRDFLLRENIRFYEGTIVKDAVYVYEVLLKAERAAFLDWALYRRRIRTGSITTKERTLDYSYEIFRTLLFMYRIFCQTESRLTEGQRDVARYRMRTALNSARNVFLGSYERCKEEELGLGDDCALFRSLVSNYCEQKKMASDTKEKAAELQKKHRSQAEKLTQQRKAAIENEALLTEVRAELESEKKRNQALQNQLKKEEENNRIRNSRSYRIGRILTGRSE